MGFTIYIWKLKHNKHMGCHTWFSVPVVTDKKKILELAQEWLSNDKYLSESSKQMYQYAIDNELITPCLELACNTYNENNIRWKLFRKRKHLSA